MSNGDSDDSSAFAVCSAQHHANDTLSILECLSSRVEDASMAKQGQTTTWLLVLSGALVFFMQAGFAMLCAGCVRKKNVQNTMLKNLLDACGAAVAWFTVGYAFAYGGQNDTADITFIGTRNFFNIGNVDQAFWFFQYAFSAASVTIVAGTLAERCQMAAYLCYSLFLTGFVYPVVVHAVWSNNGFLSAFSATPLNGIGCIDFAGSGVVHLTGGTTALLAAAILGARKGRFHDARTGRPLDKPKEFPGHSMALQLMGTMVLWFGWYGFNPGSALLLTNAPDTGKVAALAAVNTSLSSACGAISALFTNLYLQERETGEYFFSLTMAMNGALSGLVSITAACGTVENWAACVIGLLSGWLYIAGSKLLLAIKIDDAVDAIPVHMFNGAWGLIATGLFSSPGRLLAAFGTDERVGWFYSWGRGSADATLLGNNLLCLVFVFCWSVSVMLPFFVWLNYMGWFRADALEELLGLDMSYHGSINVAAQQEEEVKEEHIAELQQKKNQTMQRRRSSHRIHTSSSSTGGGGSRHGGGGSVSASGAAGGGGSGRAATQAARSVASGDGTNTADDDEISWTNMTMSNSNNDRRGGKNDSNEP